MIFILQRAKKDGFTLPEVLIAAIIAALLTAVTAQVLIGQLLEGRRLEAAQRVRENFSRLNYLIQIETSEADRIENGVTAAGCNGNGGFTLVIPRPTGTYADNNNVSRISYFNQTTDGQEVIARCGPPVTQNGQLDHLEAANTGNVPGDVVRGAQFALGCDPNILAGLEVSYQVDFTGGNFGAAVGECVVAHAKSVFVCNPPADTSIPCTDPRRRGDCDCV